MSNNVALLFPKIGRPSKIRQEHIDDLAQAGSDGETLHMWCARNKINHDTACEWVKKHPEFAEARKCHKSNLAAFYHKLGLDIVTGKIEGASATTYIWMTKNLLGWRDRLEQVDDDDTLEFVD